MNLLVRHGLVVLYRHRLDLMLLKVFSNYNGSILCFSVFFLPFWLSHLHSNIQGRARLPTHPASELQGKQAILKV